MRLALEKLDRAEEFRKAAAECVELARNTSDASTRAMLLSMAQRWCERANDSGGDIRFDSILREFNDEADEQALGPPVRADVARME